MKQTRLIMGMPVTVELTDENATKENLESVFTYLRYIDRVFSTYKKDSEITRLNNGILRSDELSDDVKEILRLAEETKNATLGYFNIEKDGRLDPSGIVKGWAVKKAADKLSSTGFVNFYIDCGGDIEVRGRKNGKPWKVGLRNPFNRFENVKVLNLSGCGVATSGTAIRGQHIYNPHRQSEIKDIVSLTVISSDVYEADRFATAAFAMGCNGINFIEKLEGFEGYMIDKNGIASKTSNFNKYVYV